MYSAGFVGLVGTDKYVEKAGSVEKRACGTTHIMLHCNMFLGTFKVKCPVWFTSSEKSYRAGFVMKTSKCISLS